MNVNRFRIYILSNAVRNNKRFFLNLNLQAVHYIIFQCFIIFKSTEEIFFTISRIFILTQFKFACVTEKMGVFFLLALWNLRMDWNICASVFVLYTKWTVIFSCKHVVVLELNDFCLAPNVYSLLSYLTMQI